MYFIYTEKEGYTKVTAEVGDICILCAYFDSCPLIGAIESHVVYPAYSQLQIEECPFYEPYI